MSKIDGNDVHFKRCISCGSPSAQGLCSQCGRPKRRRNVIEEARELEPLISHADRMTISKNAAYSCTCAGCNQARRKVFTPPPFGTWL